VQLERVLPAAKRLFPLGDGVEVRGRDAHC
jgi:hypothetical protein